MEGKPSYWFKTDGQSAQWVASAQCARGWKKVFYAIFRFTIVSTLLER